MYIILYYVYYYTHIQMGLPIMYFEEIIKTFSDILVFTERLYRWIPSNYTQIASFLYYILK